MREPVLKAVASPPKILWGPFLPVLLNLGVQFPIMFVSIGAFEINPIIFVASILLVHRALGYERTAYFQHDSGIRTNLSCNQEFV